MTTLHITVDTKPFTKQLDNLQRRQIPFATALGLNLLAGDVQVAEVRSLDTTFKNPTPFTKNSVRIRPATKFRQESKVYIMPRASAYLMPYEVGGLHKMLEPLNITFLNPKDMSFLDQYGNFPRGTLKKFKKGKKYFIGPVKFRNGKIVNGVWERVPNRNTGIKGRGLKLILRFGDALPVHQHLDFGKRAQAVVARNFSMRMSTAFERALATAR